VEEAPDEAYRVAEHFSVVAGEAVDRDGEYGLVGGGEGETAKHAEEAGIGAGAVGRSGHAYEEEAGLARWRVAGAEGEKSEGGTEGVGGVANGVALAPEVGFAVAAGVAVILEEEGSEGGARAEVSHGIGGKVEALVQVFEAEVEDEVFAVVEPFGVATDGVPGVFSEGYRAA
jgi:hypothetical protein